VVCASPVINIVISGCLIRRIVIFGCLVLRIAFSAVNEEIFVIDWPAQSPDLSPIENL